MIVLEREMYVVEGERSTPFPIRLHLLEPTVEGELWNCRLEIRWPDRPVDMTVPGIDAIDAHFAAMRIVGIRLYVGGYHLDGSLSWLAPGAGYGFPVTSNMRDLLVGNDAAYM